MGIVRNGKLLNQNERKICVSASHKNDRLNYTGGRRMRETKISLKLQTSNADECRHARQQQQKCFQFQTEMVRANCTNAHLYQQWRKKAHTLHVAKSKTGVEKQQQESQHTPDQFYDWWVDTGQNRNNIGIAILCSKILRKTVNNTLENLFMWKVRDAQEWNTTTDRPKITQPNFAVQTHRYYLVGLPITI